MIGQGGSEKTSWPSPDDVFTELLDKTTFRVLDEKDPKAPAGLQTVALFMFRGEVEENALLLLELSSLHTQPEWSSGLS